MIHARRAQDGIGHRWAASILCAALLAATGATAVAQDARRPEFAPISDNLSLPRVLVIGDSISIGYTLPLREALQGVANVHRPPENCQHTWRGLEAIDDWLGAGNWDLIHFNWGLHDLKYVDKDGRRVSPREGKQVSTVEEYESNLEKLVPRLKATGAELIWRTTTPVPEGASGRLPEDVPKFNRAAARVMSRFDIQVDDMNAFAVAEQIPHIRPNDVHFSAAFFGTARREQRWHDPTNTGAGVIGGLGRVARRPRETYVPTPSILVLEHRIVPRAD